MCGIAGIYAWTGEVDRELVGGMTRRLIHRGPDGEGFHFDPQMGLGMRRLAIMDPEHGHQPLYNEARDIAVVFNGEIYNQAELRRWLERRGHTVGSGSDGAILPHLFEELGKEFVDQLNGIFAIALWDRRSGELYLTRDKFGVKPLYWGRSNSRLYFCSELKPLLLAPDLPRDLDLQALDLFLTFRYIPSPRTPFASLKKLPPGTLLHVSRSGQSEREFWPKEISASRRDLPGLIDEYAEAFERAVVRQMMSDRPIGVMLSGGIDSAAITAVMAKHSTRVRTFTIGFEEGGDANEVELAEQTAKLFDTEHSSLVLGADQYLSRLPESYGMVEEPIGSPSALAVNFVAEMMRSSVPVALCGQGADEPLAGYWRHLGVKLACALGPIAGAGRWLANSSAASRSVRLRRGLHALSASSDLQMLMNTYRLIDDEMKALTYSPALVQASSSPPELVVEHLRKNVASLDPLSQMLYVDTRLWLPDEFLLIADKMSMAASVELRVPFLDQDLVALVESMHPSVKLRWLSRKWIHKRAARRWLPRQVIHRKERGWITPMHQWLRKELRPLVEELLLGKDELCGSLFETRELRRLIDEHAEGSADRTRELFAFLSLGLWSRAVADVPLPAGDRRPEMALTAASGL